MKHKQRPPFRNPGYQAEEIVQILGPTEFNHPDGDERFERNDPIRDWTYGLGFDIDYATIRKEQPLA